MVEPVISMERPSLGPELAAVGRLVGGLFQEHYTPSGELPCFTVDGRTGKPVGSKDLLTELGDYLPLLAASGWAGYTESQATVIAARLADPTEPLNPDPGALPRLRRQNPFYFSDLLLGLLDCHALGLAGPWLDLARDLTNRMLKFFWLGDGLCKERLAAIGWRLPINESNTLVMAELMLDLYRADHREEYLDQARRMLEPWLALARAQGAVPQVRFLAFWPRMVPRFSSRSGVYLLYKHNYFFLAALDELARCLDDEALGRAAVDLTLAADQFFSGDQPVPCYQVVRDGSGLRRDTPTLKGTLLAEHLCDLAMGRDRPDLLDRASEQAAFWLDQRNPATGLIPYRLGGRASDVDSLTDFAVTLIKLGAATGRRHWRDAALGLLGAMLDHHMGPYGLYQSLDVMSGEVLDPAVHTRYVSLFLKPWLLLANLDRVYKWPLLMSLVRDR